MTEKAIRNCLLCFFSLSLSHCMFVLPCCLPTYAPTSDPHVIHHRSSRHELHPSGLAEGNAVRPVFCARARSGHRFADGNVSIRQRGLKRGGLGGAYQQRHAVRAAVTLCKRLTCKAMGAASYSPCPQPPPQLLHLFFITGP